MTCAELEILLCDYLDGTLRLEQRSELESHLSGCSACAQLAHDAAGVTAFLETVSAAEPPAELMTRILHQAPRGRQVDGGGAAGMRKLWGGWMESVLQPRYVMGMAMTILSLSMLARFAHIEPRQLQPSDLDPVKVWQGIDDRSHRAWDRAMKYYDNLRLVIEIQSRLREWSEQEQIPNAEATFQKPESSRPKTQPGGNERGSQQ